MAMWLNLGANFGTLEVMSCIKRSNFEPICNKSENTYLKEMQIRLWEISQIWCWEIQKHPKQDFAVRESRRYWHESWFWFLHKEVGRVYAHPWLQVVQVDDHHIYHRMRFSAERLVFSPRRTCPQSSPTSPSLVWTSTSITPRRQLTASSSILSRVQRRLTTMWRRWGTASLTSIWTTTC